MSGIRVIAVDDHPPILTGLRHFLDSQGDMRLVGEGANPEDAVRLARALKPDVAILDLRLGDEATGIETCREMRSPPDRTRVVVYSGHDSPGDLLGAALAGADAYLHKSADLTELPTVIRNVHAGKPAWSCDDRDAAKARAYSVAQTVRLTGREWDVFTHMYRGYTNDRIAAALQISSQTVKSHVRRVLKKLHAENRRELFG